MRTKTYILAFVATLAVGVTFFTVEAMANRGHGALGVVYVTSQGSSRRNIALSFRHALYSQFLFSFD
jgi:hypothetical protein